MDDIVVVNRKDRRMIFRCCDANAGADISPRLGAVPSRVTPLDVAAVRSGFPALAHGRPDAYLDGPGGTQVPAPVIEAIRGAMAAGMGNVGGRFDRSHASDVIVASARDAVADLFDADPDEVVFGQNMTSLTFSFSRHCSALGAGG